MTMIYSGVRRAVRRSKSGQRDKVRLRFYSPSILVGQFVPRCSRSVDAGHERARKNAFKEQEDATGEGGFHSARLTSDAAERGVGD